MRENDGSAFALVDIGHSPALDFPELLSSERFCAIGLSFLLLTLRSAAGRPAEGRNDETVESLGFSSSTRWVQVAPARVSHPVPATGDHDLLAVVVSH
jgi:hypothetical protein